MVDPPRHVAQSREPFLAFVRPELQAQNLFLAAWCEAPSSLVSQRREPPEPSRGRTGRRPRCGHSTRASAIGASGPVASVSWIAAPIRDGREFTCRDIRPRKSRLRASRLHQPLRTLPASLPVRPEMPSSCASSMNTTEARCRSKEAENSPRAALTGRIDQVLPTEMEPVRGPADELRSRRVFVRKSVAFLPSKLRLLPRVRRACFDTASGNGSSGNWVLWNGRTRLICNAQRHLPISPTTCTQLTSAVWQVGQSVASLWRCALPATRERCSAISSAFSSLSCRGQPAPSRTPAPVGDGYSCWRALRGLWLFGAVLQGLRGAFRAPCGRQRLQSLPWRGGPLSGRRRPLGR